MNIRAIVDSLRSKGIDVFIDGKDVRHSRKYGFGIWIASDEDTKDKSCLLFNDDIYLDDSSDRGILRFSTSENMALRARLLYAGIVWIGV